MTKNEVLIVGAGPTGLALALWLTKLGVRVRVIDKTAEPGTTSRALAVQVRTLELYRQLGLADLVISGGVKIAGLNFWVKGAKVARAPLQRIGEGLTPYPFVLVYPQDAHERLLAEQLHALDVQIERRTELVSFDRNSGGIRAVLKLSDGTKEQCETSYLAGCDGASSTVREQLGIDFSGGTYAGLFYVADVEATGPATDGELHIDLEEADFVLVFPLKGTGRIRLVGTVHDATDSEHQALTFDDVKGRAISNLQLNILKVNWFSTYHVHHRVAARFREGRAFLLGDAAHIHSPVGGQGMNTGIGDAVNLAWKLAALMKGDASESLLDTYELERISFARRLVATTDRVFTLVTSRGPTARFIRTRIAPFLAPLLFRLGPLRRFFFRTVSQTGIHYRNSPLSAGHAGHLHGGDRLPWVEIARGIDSFAPLASLSWQVHLYGESPPSMRETCSELGLPLHLFSWQPRMRQIGLKNTALYLIRPDGHIALADPHADPKRLRQYFVERRLATDRRA
jgi:2-polyprenyl-6-methoxyphenol hydroxylase-like FAD-dependent oxidoreductase